MSQKAYITTPIYYPSGAPHIGSAYTSVACDVYARAMRLDGRDTKFLTGTDEHGLKLQRAAEKDGLSPQQYVDKMSERFRALEHIVSLSNDDFIRTTEPRHEKAAIAMWNKLNDAGFIYKDTYAGWYSVPDESYYTEEELIDGKSPDSGHPVEWVEEESYYFKLSAFGDKLLAYYEENPTFIQPESRKNEVIAFVKSGLRDLSISRSTFNWGVPVPNDDKHVMYVWVDALTNYLSALGWPESTDWADYFQQAIHVIGKDILKFHAIYWPAMLMAAEVPLPKQIFAHGFWVADGQKMSKSKGNVIDPVEMTETFGIDQLRYYMLRDVSFGQDGDFSKDRLIGRINTDLSNDLGNLFQRVLSMVHKNCDGQTPDLGKLTSEDQEFLNHVGPEFVDHYLQHIEKLEFHKALDVVWGVVRAANKYMDNQQPWSLKKENPERMAQVLRVLMEAFCPISLLVEPFLPNSAPKLQQQVGFTGKTFTDLRKGTPMLETGAKIEKPEGVFMRYMKEEAA